MTAVARMEARRRLERLNFCCAVVLTSWFMGLLIGVAQAQAGMY